MKNTKEELDGVLTDVRKAYRLLFVYQKRVLDLTNYIGSYYGFSYNGGWPMFSNPTPKRGQGKLHNWSWDWLNMYFYQFYFGEKDIAEKKLQFAVFHQADTGFYNSFGPEKELEHMSKIDLNIYESVHDSESYIILVIGYNKWPIGDAWNDKEFLTSAIKEGVRKDSDDKLIMYKRYKISLFANQESTVEVLQDFSRFCNENGITLPKSN